MIEKKVIWVRMSKPSSRIQWVWEYDIFLVNEGKSVGCPRKLCSVWQSKWQGYQNCDKIYKKNPGIFWTWSPLCFFSLILVSNFREYFVETCTVVNGFGNILFLLSRCYDAKIQEWKTVIFLLILIVMLSLMHSNRNEGILSLESQSTTKFL